MALRSGSQALIMIFLLTAVSVAIPLAMADHTYSHRYIVYGRVVDVDGNPVQGYDVALVTDQYFRAEGPCAAQPDTGTDAWERTETRPVTNQYGEFTYCSHSHQMSRAEPGTGVFRVEDPEGREVAVVEDVRFDFNRRVSFVNIQLTERATATTDAFDSTYSVIGRIWQNTGERQLDGVRVYGLTFDQEPVTVTLTYNNGKTASVETQTNNYGDFAVRLPVEERPVSGTVTVETAQQKWTKPVDATFGATTFTADVDRERGEFLMNALKIGGGILLVTAVIGGGLYGYRNLAAKREEAAARARSTRRRAQR